MSNTIKDQLSAAIGARKDSLKALRARIIDLLEKVPVGVKLSDDNGMVVNVARICTGASQWSNRTWDVTIKGWGLIDAGGRLIGEKIDNSYWDGNNMHVRSTEPTRLHKSSASDFDECESLSWASGKTTREIAARLPEAIARYIAECEAERTANESTVVA